MPRLLGIGGLSEQQEQLLVIGGGAVLLLFLFARPRQDTAAIGSRVGVFPAMPKMIATPNEPVQQEPLTPDWIPATPGSFPPTEDPYSPIDPNQAPLPGDGQISPVFAPWSDPYAVSQQTSGPT